MRFTRWMLMAVLAMAGWAAAQTPAPAPGDSARADTSRVDSARTPVAKPDTAAADTAKTKAKPKPKRPSSKPKPKSPKPKAPASKASVEGDSTAAPDTAAVPVEAPGPKVRFEVYVENNVGAETLMGVVVIELNPVHAPKHTANFLKLVKKGYYEGVAFHRIVPNFIVQGGDPKSRVNWRAPDLGTGGPAYTIPPEFGLKHVRGAVAAARLDDSVNPEKASNGSQFYICLSDLPALDEAGYTVFGKVVEGMTVMDKVAQVKNAGSENQNRALSRVFLKNFTITEAPKAK